MNKLIDRTGEERVMNNGQKAKIVAYRSTNDMDIEFEYGIIVEHRSYSDFSKGKIANLSYKLYESRLGEERVMNNGQKAKILIYRNYQDIDIEFEDGTIVEHRNYYCFKRCQLTNPNYNPNSKLGEERLMTNDQKAKIIVYRNNHDIDIEFEDGTKVEHKTYQHFKQGQIVNPNYKPNIKLGEEKLMNNGQKAKIIVYRKADDIDVEFEDGTIVEHRKYDCFNKGNISNPKYNPNSKLGEERLMNNGQKAKILVYRNADDIDVEFEDATIVEHKSYGSFKNGHIANPNYNPYENRLGEERVMTNGQKAKIVAYRYYADIDVEFEDGTLVEHRTYSYFKKGCITNPNYNPNSKLGEENLMNNGQKAKIVCYRSAADIDIEFEDGAVVKSRTYADFKKGKIANPNYKPYENRLGEEKIMHNDQKAKILVYRNYTDIDIEFEDGTIVEHKRYGDFKKGVISNPNYNSNSKYKLGEERVMNNGQKARIITYRSCTDIDVEFEDGTIVKNKTYKNFKKRKIANPNYNLYENRLGEERVMTNGQKAKIVAYRYYADIDVEFEDGTLIEHRTYEGFKRGYILNPNYNYKSKLGEERVMTNGQKAKILSYRNCTDIDVEFEDSTVVEQRRYDSFKKGQLTNPNLVKGGKVGSYRIIKKWCTHRDEKIGEVRYALWECKCEKCGEERLIKPQMMLEHTC